MNALIIVGIALASVAVYLVGGFYTGRAYSRHCYRTCEWTIESSKRESAIAGFVLGGLFWPVMLWWVIFRLVICRRLHLSVGTLVPEIAAKDAERREHDLNVKLNEQAREIERLHRQIGIES